MAINILRVSELDVWRWLEQSSHPTLNGWTSDQAIVGPWVHATLWLAVADRVVIDAGGGSGEEDRGREIPFAIIRCTRYTTGRGRQALAQPPLISVG
jgi:hypothetical protein